MDTDTAWKKLCFISYSLNFHLIDNQSVAIHTLAWYMLISLSVDEILLPKYVKWSTHFRGLPLWVEMFPSCYKYAYSVLFAFILGPILPATCCRLHGNDSAWTCIFLRSNDHLNSLCLSYLQLPLTFFLIRNHFLLLDLWMFKVHIDRVQAIGLMSRVFVNGPGNQGSIPGQVIPKIFKKWYFDATLIKCGSYWKGRLWVTLN